MDCERAKPTYISIQHSLIGLSIESRLCSRTGGGVGGGVWKRYVMYNVDLSGRHQSRATKFLYGDT